MSGLAQGLRSAAIAGFRALPPGWRERLKGVLGALGHAPGWAQRLRARQLAETTKRLDRWAPELAAMLRTAGVTSLRGASCLEFGSGHLLTEPLLHHLLGARRSLAVDYFPIIEEGLLSAVCDGVDEEALVSALAPFEAPEAVRERYRALLARQDWSLAGLAELGIAYRAPYDAAAGPLAGEAFDLIASCSVLEHVPATQAAAILANLAAILAPGGTMVHAVHLEDHRDFKDAPFAFLAAGTDWTEADADKRGNRLRASDWLRIARAVPGVDLVADEPEVRRVALPAQLDPRFAGYDRDDLRTKRLVIALRKRDGAGAQAA